MPSPETSTRRIIRRLEAEGWVNRGGGRHDVFEHPQRQGRIAVPRHRAVSTFVARQIAKLAGWKE
jgi:predicted RNA binding protein YcfA (HicA-like mRNA interferase family)